MALVYYAMQSTAIIIHLLILIYLYAVDERRRKCLKDKAVETKG